MEVVLLIAVPITTLSFESKYFPAKGEGFTDDFLPSCVIVASRLLLPFAKTSTYGGKN